MFDWYNFCTAKIKVKRAVALTIRPKMISVTGDKTVSHQQVKHVAQRALDIERYILRRAWGLCYAIVGSGNFADCFSACTVWVGGALV
jgi:hypothetical protein